MDVQIIEGTLSEAPTADATGMDRRAFGEFVGPQGELASYALGWTTGGEPRTGRLTIGIGAGNPGGATIHAEVFDNDGAYALSLVDEPFAEVPEGGPHLSAEQARRHPDLPFIWWVSDHVTSTDRRAHWMLHWLLGTSAIQTSQVFAGTEPVLLVVHDADDDLWQLIGTTDAAEDGRIAHLSHAIDADLTLLDVLDLRPGESAERRHVGGAWTRRQV